MQNIRSTINLNEAIHLLIIEHATNGLLFRKQFHQTYERLKPVSLLRGTLEDISSSLFLLTNIIGTTAGLLSGYLSKKIVVGSSANRFRKLFRTRMQIGAANTVARHPDAIKKFGQFVLQYFMCQKETEENQKP